MRWQMALYNETSGKAEDAENPEKVVKRVQEVSAVLYHIELVRKQHHLVQASYNSTVYMNLNVPYGASLVPVVPAGGHFIMMSKQACSVLPIY